MPRTNTPNKPVRSFRLSLEGVRQLKELAIRSGRSESDVIEIALDRMYREELRYERMVQEGARPETIYQTKE